jgi:predicted RNase H-like HicB family nuclease
VECRYSKLHLEGLHARLVFDWQEDYNSSMTHLTLPIIVESDEDGYFVTCPSLQGCYSQGETYEEAMANIKDAIRLHVEDRLADGEEIPQRVSVSLSTVEIAV